MRALNWTSMKSLFDNLRLSKTLSLLSSSAQHPLSLAVRFVIDQIDRYTQVLNLFDIKIKLSDVLFSAYILWSSIHLSHVKLA